jgi:hypothetical protein
LISFLSFLRPDGSDPPIGFFSKVQFSSHLKTFLSIFLKTADENFKERRIFPETSRVGANEKFITLLLRFPFKDPLFRKNKITIEFHSKEFMGQNDVPDAQGKGAIMEDVAIQGGTNGITYFHECGVLERPKKPDVHQSGDGALTGSVEFRLPDQPSRR